jgi:spore coat assembly protein SafA
MFTKNTRFNFLSVVVIAAVLASLVSLAPSVEALAACGTTYTVQSGDTLTGIAQACGTTFDALVRANPALQSTSLITPGQVLLLPGAIVKDPSTGNEIYIVQPNDYLAGLAAQFGVTLSALEAANPDITTPSLIYPGQRIVIPTSGIPITGGQPAISIQPVSGQANTQVSVNGVGFPANAVVYVYLGQSGSQPTFSQELTSASDGTFSTALSIPTSAQAGTTWVFQATTSAGGGLAASATFTVLPILSGNVYTVQPGDTLSGLATEFNTTVAALLQANPSITDASLIYAGQQIVIPSGSIIPNTGTSVYIVQSGDTLSGIAAAYNTTVAALLQANPSITDASLIYPGEQIVIPYGTIIPNTGASVYTVQSGDTMWSIAQSFGVSLSALEAANPQIGDPSLIYPGQQIAIP